MPAAIPAITQLVGTIWASTLLRTVLIDARVHALQTAFRPRRRAR